METKDSCGFVVLVDNYEVLEPKLLGMKLMLSLILSRLCVS